MALAARRMNPACSRRMVGYPRDDRWLPTSRMGAGRDRPLTLPVPFYATALEAFIPV
jgi:hypothetical protein